MINFTPIRGHFDEPRQSLVLPVSPGRRLALSSWDQGLGVHLETETGRFVADAPPLLVLDPSMAPAPLQPAVKEYLCCLPDQVLESVHPFRWRQFTVLQLIKASEAYHSLLREAPMIAWLLADHVRAVDFPVARAAMLSEAPRRAMLTTLFGECSQALVKTLGKVVPAAMDRQGIQTLLTICRSPWMVEALAHCPRIDLDALSICAASPDIISHPLVLREIQAPDASANRLRVIKMLLHGCFRFQDHYAGADFARMLRQCGTLEELKHRFQDLHERHNIALARQRGALIQEEEQSAAIKARVAAAPRQPSRRPQRPRPQPQRPLATPRRQVRGNAPRPEQHQPDQQGQGRPAPFFETDPATGRRNRVGLRFPPPPLPGNEYIQPLTTSGQLIEEGETMKNCVGKGYARDVLAGLSYIYRVLHPQRCSLELGFRHDGTPYIKELKGVENCPPSNATKRFIKDWLAGKHRSMHD